MRIAHGVACDIERLEQIERLAEVQEVDRTGH